MFTEYTSCFLDVTDIVKFLMINRAFRATALKYNSKLFTKIYSQRIWILNSRVAEWTENNCFLNRKLGLLEAKEKARNTMLQNVNDQRIRSIIEKHVIQPMLGNNRF